MKPSDHIVKGAKCCVCNEAPATVLSRFVAADDNSAGDAMLWAGATCWECARTLGSVVAAASKDQYGEDHRTDDQVVDAVTRSLLALDIEDDRTFDEKLRDGDAHLEPDEPHCEVCAWPKRLCICAGSKRAQS